VGARDALGAGQRVDVARAVGVVRQVDQRDRAVGRGILKVVGVEADLDRLAVGVREREVADVEPEVVEADVDIVVRAEAGQVVAAPDGPAIDLRGEPQLERGWLFVVGATGGAQRQGREGGDDRLHGSAVCADRRRPRAR
jgi:hypothetical protein